MTINQGVDSAIEEFTKKFGAKWPARSVVAAMEVAGLQNKIREVVNEYLKSEPKLSKAQQLMVAHRALSLIQFNVMAEYCRVHLHKLAGQAGKEPGEEQETADDAKTSR